HQEVGDRRGHAAVAETQGRVLDRAPARSGRPPRARDGMALLRARRREQGSARDALGAAPGDVDRRRLSGRDPRPVSRSRPAMERHDTSTADRPPGWAVAGTAVGASLFIGGLLVYVPYALTGWRFAPPFFEWAPTRWIGAALIALAIPVLVDF